MVDREMIHYSAGKWFIIPPEKWSIIPHGVQSDLADVIIPRTVSYPVIVPGSYLVIVSQIECCLVIVPRYYLVIVRTTGSYPVIVPTTRS